MSTRRHINGRHVSNVGGMMNCKNCGCEMEHVWSRGTYEPPEAARHYIRCRFWECQLRGRMFKPDEYESISQERLDEIKAECLAQWERFSKMKWERMVELTRPMVEWAKKKRQG